MQEETEKLQKAKIEIESKAIKDREETLSILNKQHKQEEDKRQNDRFKGHIKEVERKIVEANECVKFMRKNIKFSYQLVSVMPETFRLDTGGLADNQVQARQEIQIKAQNFDSDAIYEWSLKKFYDKLEEIKDKMDSF